VKDSASRLNALKASTPGLVELDAGIETAFARWAELEGT
jgi:hypothetical protein